MSLERTHAKFGETHLALVAAMSDADPGVRSRAFDELFRLYWPPVYAYLRWKGLNKDLAAETTEAFFVERVWDKRLFEQFDPERGRLRTLMLRWLEHFCVDAARRETTRRTIRGERHGAMDEARLESIGSADHADPEQAFFREWCASLVRGAAERTAEHFRESGKEGHWRLFAAVHLPPLGASAVRRTQSEVAAELRIRNPGSVLQVVSEHMMKELEIGVRASVGPGTDVAEELALIRAGMG